MNAGISLDKRNSFFTTKLVRPEGVDTWTFAPIPVDISNHAGLKAKMRVKGTIDGVPLKSSLMAGSGELFIVIAKELRDKIGKQAGDLVKMTLGPDTSTDTIHERESKGFVRENGPSHKKAYVQWITQARTKETRTNRIGKAIQQISVGKTLR